MLKKGLCLLLTTALLAASLIGCGATKDQTAGTAAETGAQTAAQPAAAQTQAAAQAADAEAQDNQDEDFWDDDPAEVNWYMWSVGGAFTPDGVQAVEDALNEITLEKINVQVHLNMLDMGAYMTQMPMQVTAGDKVDLITTFPAGSGSYKAMMNSGQLLPLNDLIESSGQALKEVLPDGYLKATTVKGNIYAVPILTDNTTDVYWCGTKDLFDETGMNAADIKTMDDLTPMFEKVYEAHPDMILISTGSKSLVSVSDAEILGNGAAIDISEGADYTKVISYYESDAYKDQIYRMREWYEAGYVDKDAPIREDEPAGDLRVFSGFVGGNYSRVASFDALAGREREKIKVVDGIVKTDSMTILTMGIPVTSTEPEAAMRLLALTYTDKDVKQLVSYGIEGVNYTFADNGGIVSSTDNNSYAPNTIGIFGSALLCDPTENDVNIGYRMSDIDQNALRYSPVMGFTISTDNVDAEAAALSAVINEYSPMLECGQFSDDDYSAFIDKLYASGLQKYLDDVQSQLDAWLAE